jgi:GNAT superfamily N-acetyltransferase
MASESTTTLTPGIHALTPSHPQLEVILKSIVGIHASVILNDHTMATYLPPLSLPVMTEDWASLVDQTSDPKRRFILFSVDKVSERSSGSQVICPFEDGRWPTFPSSHPHQTNEPTDQEQELELSGVVSLSHLPSQTGPHRAQIERLFISPFHRRKRLATTLLQELERRALELGYWNLMLDTPAEAPSARFYEACGWERLGLVREYGIDPRTGALVDEVWFWKDVRSDEQRKVGWRGHG